MQAQLESERKAGLAALATEQEGKILVQVSRQSATHSACLTTCVLQAKGSVDYYLWCFADALLSVFLLSFPILQASLEIAQEGAKRMSATKSALEQEVQRMAQAVGCFQRLSHLTHLCSPLATLVIVFNHLSLLQQALAREARLKQDKGTVVESLKVKHLQHAQAQ